MARQARPRTMLPCTVMPLVLPPTGADLTDPSCRPYFLWWTDAPGALLREANTRDVWLYVTPDEIRAQWGRLLRHLGRSRERWAFLLGMEAAMWPPSAARRA